jgi:hypothetical protein
MNPPAIVNSADVKVAIGKSRIAPNFLIIGAKKACTTTLYKLLLTHPKVWMPAQKEPAYFASASFGSRDAADAYFGLFAASSRSAIAIGEASTAYTTLPHNGPTPHRIRQVLGQPKLIYLMRDPVDRVVSNYRHWVARKPTVAAPSLTEALRQSSILIDTSRYAFQLQQYFDVFERESICVLLAEELIRSPHEILGQVQSFLALPPHEWPQRIPQANSSLQLRSTVQLKKLVRSDALWQMSRRLIPEQCKGVLRACIQQIQPPLKNPAVTASEIQHVLDLVADDLEQLHRWFGDRLLVWPSARRVLGIEDSQ